MSDFIFATEKAESLRGGGGNQRITISGTEQHTRKNGGKTRMCTLTAKMETKVSSRRLNLLLPAVLINFLPQFIGKVLKIN